MLSKLSYKSLAFGVSFDEDNRTVSLIFINYFFILLFGLILIIFYITGEEMSFLTYRYHSLILIAVINLFLVKYHYLRVAKFLLLLYFPFAIMILPNIGRISDDDFYFWFPYLPIAFALIAHFILHPKKEQIQIIGFIIIYGLMGVLNDNVMIHVSETETEIIKIVKDNKFYYNLIPFIIYVFVNLALFLLIWKNYIYENALKDKQKNLEASNQTLVNQKEELQLKNEDINRTLKQLYEARDKLIQSEKLAALGTLTTGIAHEINNPLNFISASLNNMHSICHQNIDFFKTDDQSAMYNQITNLMSYADEGASKIADIVTKMGSLKGTSRNIKEEITVLELINSSLNNITPKVPTKVEIIKNIPEYLRINCKVAEIENAIQNLLDNAIEAINTGKNTEDQIIISASNMVINHTDHIMISIGNTGPQIPDIHIQKIFDPFFSTKSNIKNTGLGLSFCFNVIQQHNGNISVENVENMVIFRIILPVDSAS